MDINLTKEMVIDHLGQPNKKENNELVWRCPICQDKSADNMKYNTIKNVLYCFADENHSKFILSEIYKKNKPQPIHTSDTKQWQINTDEYTLYQDECNRALMANDNALNYLYEHRMINPFTVEKCGIGYDNEDKNRAKWVFPVFSLDNKIKGFEYRGWDFTNKKVWKEIDTPACMCQIYGKAVNKNLYIIEGFLDAYLYAQVLNYDEDSTIYTPSNGCGSLKNCISEVRFGNFKNIYLIMDMDEAGQKATNEVIEIFPFIIKKDIPFTNDELKRGNTDFTDYWRIHKND